MKKKTYDIKLVAVTHELPISTVPCQTINCTQCCELLSPYLTEEEFESGKYVYTLMKDPSSDLPVIAVPRTEQGCFYLSPDKKCTIYNDRPLACKQFDCRQQHHSKIQNKFKEEKMKLNLGAGDQRFEGFVNIDYDKNANPDYCFNMETDPWPFEDNSVDQVIAHHVLEHMGEGYFHCLQELYRVCEHGAMIDILVPHHRHDYFLDDPTHRRPITLNGLRLFSKKYNDLCREQNARSSRLGYYYGVDFEVTDYLEIPSEFYIKYFEGKPKTEVEQYMSERANIIEEVHIKLTVIKDHA